MTTRERQDAARHRGILGRLVSILERLQRLPGDGVDDASHQVQTIWQRLVEPDVVEGQEAQSSLSGAPHELLTEYAFRSCTSACSALVCRLGEGSTLGPLVALLRRLVGESSGACDAGPAGDIADDRQDHAKNGDDATEADAKVDANLANRESGQVGGPGNPSPTTSTQTVSGETINTLTKVVHVFGALRIVLACLEQADLYFSLEGASALVAVSMMALSYGHEVCGRRREAGIRYRERVRQSSVLLQLEVIKLLLMVSRRYGEVLDEARTGGALAKLLVRVWVESEEDAVPISWVQDSAEEVMRRESSLLQSMMSLMGSSLSWRSGKEADDRGKHGGEYGNDIVGAGENIPDASAADDSAGPSPRTVEAEPSTKAGDNEAADLPASHSLRKTTNAYDSDHPLQTLSALLVLRLRFAVPAFQAGLQDVISPSSTSLSSKTLLAMLSKRIALSESSRLLMHVLLQNNKEFMNYCMSRTDVDVLVIPLLERLYAVADKETTSMNELYIMVILLLVFTGDKAFVMSANGSVVKDQDTAWYTTRNIKGIRLDSLMLLVLLHVGMLSTYAPLRRDVYLHTNTMATIANMAPTMADMHPVACQRLIGVLEKLGNTKARLQRSSEISVDNEMIGLIEDFQNLIFEVINAIIANCLTSNATLVYAMLHKRDVIARFASDGSSELKELSENVNAVVDYFGGLLPVADLEAASSPGSRSSPSDADRHNGASASSLSKSFPESLSAEKIQEIIANGMSAFQADDLPLDTTELRFGFEEEADSAMFFLPYIDDMLDAIML